ncbi:hypothetical protein F5Y10DRAFT_246280 [Nemania abortiva]|nr:hypothetical protein F5Y10DRAFT_246280 [Nemania abortiva]
MLPRGGRARIPFRRVPLVNQQLDGPGQPPELKNYYNPSPKQCIEAKRIIAKATNFPPELVDIVMDYAEYWACTTTSIDYSVTGSRHLAINSGRDRENKFLLRTEPLGLTAWHTDDKENWQTAAPPCKLNEEYTREELERFVDGPATTLEHPFRKIVFDIVSRDQGWSGDIESHHTYRSSWTWFDAGIDRFDKGHTRSAESTGESEPEASSGTDKPPPTSAIRPVWPRPKENSSEYDHPLHPTDYHKIQCNRVAEHDWQHHHVEWSSTDNIDPDSSGAEELEANGRGRATGDGSFLRSLKVGDMVTVWGRTRFGSWVNNIQKVQVQVYWAL